MRHDSQVLTARFIAGELGRAQRWRFQRHLVDCEECWTHVRGATAGRAALESLREVAPARTRERVRAISGLSTDHEHTDGTVGRRRWATMPVTAAAIATVAAVVIGVATLGGGGSPLTPVISAYHGTTAWAPAADQPPAAELAGLRWTATTATSLDGARVLGHRYVRPDGATVLVVRGMAGFPQPPGARPVPGGDWITEIDGVTVFCTVAPVSLVIGTDLATVTGAAHALTTTGR